MTRPGTTVLFRHGYYGQRQLVPFDRRTFLTYSRVVAAALYPQQIRDIKLRLKASYDRGGNGGGDVVAELRIDVSRVKLAEKAGRREGRLDIAFFCANADGAGIGELWRTFSVSLTAEEHKRAERDGITYTMRIPTTSYPRMAKVVVYDYAGDVVGTAETQIY